MFRNIIIAGLGALGSHLAENLGRFRPRQVLLVDPDILETKNMERSALWRNAKQGEPKVIAAARELQLSFPATQWIGRVSEVADLAPRDFIEMYLLLSAVDTDLARLEMAAIAARYSLPMCDGGLGGTTLFVGRVSWFPSAAGFNSACFSCLLSARRRAELLSTWESEQHSCWHAQPSHDPAWSSASTTARRIARLQTMIAVRAMACRTAWPSQTIQIDFGSKSRVRRIYHLRSEECPFHDSEVRRGELFPQCTGAVCQDCGLSVQTAVRIGWLRRWARCERCGGRLVPNDLRRRPYKSESPMVEIDGQLT